MTFERSKSEPGRLAKANDRALRWVGDLDHPFYDDERQRFIWYEASTVGFQMMLMLQIVVSATILLVMGGDGLDYFLVGLGPAMVVTLITVQYAKGRGAEYFPQRSDLRRSRSIAGLALMVLCIAAAVRLWLDMTDRGGFSTAFPLGMAVGLAAAVAGGFFAARKRKLAEESDDEI